VDTEYEEVTDEEKNFIQLKLVEFRTSRRARQYSTPVYLDVPDDKDTIKTPNNGPLNIAIMIGIQYKKDPN
jgi:hypothetical protein